LKIIIKGIIEANSDENEQKEIQQNLQNYAKELYIQSWLKNAQEDEDNPDLEQEKKDANNEFDYNYNE
jgi:hypothetical protein